LSHHFCHLCNRLRMTASGQLRPCLLHDRQIDLIGPLRRGASDHELSQLFLTAALKKPYAHRLASEISSPPSAQMSAIGG
jgi:cyclic pyranopterin phosphate synthase